MPEGDKYIGLHIYGHSFPLGLHSYTLHSTAHFSHMVSLVSSFLVKWFLWLVSMSLQEATADSLGTTAIVAIVLLPLLKGPNQTRWQQYNLPYWTACLKIFKAASRESKLGQDLAI